LNERLDTERETRGQIEAKLILDALFGVVGKKQSMELNNDVDVGTKLMTDRC